jgi:DNA-binding winged helix-turn-helix (wHTH) protein/TolB-like protein
MRLKTGRLYEFGEFRLEPEERLLTRRGRPVPLAPKAFDLLTVLVQNHGRLVSKDAIMESVWSGSFVEDANLTVSISVLRKVFGQKEGGPQHIETIPKKGYRFVAPVTEVDSPIEPGYPLNSEAASLSPPTRHVEETTAPNGTVVVESRWDDGNLSSRQRGAGVGQVGEGVSEENIKIDRDAVLHIGTTPPARVPSRAWDKRLAAVVLVILVTGLAGSVWRFYFRGPRVPKWHQPQSLAILPLQNLKHDPEYDFLSYSLADAIITKLDYVSSLTVRPSSAAEKYRGKSLDYQSIASDLKVDALLTGTFLREGQDLRITYQLIDVKSERVLGTGTVDLKYDNLLRVQDQVAQQVIQTLNLNVSSAEAERVRAGAAISPLAYEYYLRGVDLHGQHKFPLAIKMLEKSTEIDPNYALAWAYLGASYTSDAAFELGGREQYRRAQAAYERALAIQPSQLDAQMFLANLLVDTGNVEQAMPLLRNALALNPNYAPMHWELGYTYRFAGMLDASVSECEWARQIDPLVKSNGSVLNSYLYLGAYDKFLRSLPEASDSSFILFYRGLGEYYQNNLQLAAKDFDQAYAMEVSLYTQIGKALSASMMHRETDGLQILHALESKIAERGVGDPEATYKIAQAYAVLGDKASALRILRRSVESGFFCYPYFTTDPLLNSLRGEPEFKSILEIARLRHESFKRVFF